MSTSPATSTWFAPPDDPDYPSRDGKPMADNNKQFTWIADLKGGIDAIFLDNPDVYVAGNCLWYPVEGHREIRMAPDVFVVFGRPKGDRGSYLQFREDGVPVQVAFEVISPGNRAGEMRRKLKFCETYGVEEYYIVDPDHGRHKGYLRDATGQLRPIVPFRIWVSPRLGIRFETIDGFLHLTGPDGRPLESYNNLFRQRNRSQRDVEQARHDANRERLAAEQAQRDANHERLAAEQAQRDANRERLAAEQAQRDFEQAQRDAERERLTADQARRDAEQAQRDADRERLTAEQAQRDADRERLTAEQAQRDADRERLTAERLRVQLRALGMEPEG